MDFMKQKILKFEQAKYIILDEADEMLNMGFLEPVQEIISSFNKDKKAWMFSATMPTLILNLIKREFNNPKVIKTKNKSLSNDDIDQKYFLIKSRYHQEALCRLIDMEPDMHALVFCKTRMDTKNLAEELLLKGYSASALHGEMNQSQRDYSMQRFKNKKTKLMICTDVAARGIDVNNLTHVINFGVPQELESYVHRIGRTGRAGLRGTAITLLDPSSIYKLRKIEGLIKKKIKLAELPSSEDLRTAAVKKGIDQMSNTINIIAEKGEDFKIDKTFDIFKEKFEKLTKEQVLKVLFSTNFNNTLKRYNGTLDTKTSGNDNKRKNNNNMRNQRNNNLRNSNNVRLFMNAGKVDGLKFNNFLDDFSKQSGIRRDNIQNVDFKENFSFLEIPKNDGNKIVGNKNFNFNNKRVHFEYSK